MTPERRAEMDLAIANHRTLHSLDMLQEALAEIDRLLNEPPQFTLNAEGLRQRLLSILPPEVHQTLNGVFAGIEIPIGPMYERDRMQAEIERLTPRWQEGEPPRPKDSFCDVWREGVTHPVCVGWFGDVGCCYWYPGYPPSPWGTARWAPIVKPV